VTEIERWASNWTFARIIASAIKNLTILRTRRELTISVEEDG